MFDWLETTSLALWVKESWGFPFALTLHTFGAATMVGLAFIMCLSTLGLFSGLPPTSLPKLIPFIWFGLGVQIVSGTLLVTSTRTNALLSLAFWVEMAVIATGALVTVRLTRTLAKEGAVSPGGRASTPAVWLGGAAATIWAVVLLSARLRGFSSSSYSTESQWLQVMMLALTAIAAVTAMRFVGHLDKESQTGSMKERTDHV